jgi:hypothetical protein
LSQDVLITLIIGGVIIVLGIDAFIWGKIEEGACCTSVSGKTNVREFADHSPGRPEPNALRIGVRSASLGIVMLLVSSVSSVSSLDPSDLPYLSFVNSTSASNSQYIPEYHRQSIDDLLH